MIEKINFEKKTAREKLIKLEQKHENIHLEEKGFRYQDAKSRRQKGVITDASAVFC